MASGLPGVLLATRCFKALSRMKDTEIMSSMGKSASFMIRILLAFLGLIALFAPGFVLFLLCKSTGYVIQRLTDDERKTVMAMLFQNDSHDLRTASDQSMI